MKFLNGVDVEDGHIQLSDTYKIQWGGSNARIDGSNASDYIRLWTSDTERMRITSAGNVGIGTTSPGRQIELRGQGVIRLNAISGGDPGLDFNTSDVNDMQIRYRSTTDALAIYSYGTSSDVLTIKKSDGNVGIGTTSPQVKLHVEGRIRSTYDGNTAWYSGNYVRLFNSQSFGFLNSSGSSIAQINLNGNSYFNGGNVGIGTTSPIGKIDIRGNYGRWRINGYGGMYFRNDSDTDYTRYIHPRSDGSLSFGRIADTALSGTNPDKFAASSYDQFYLDSSGTAYFNGGINFAGVNGANFVVDTDGQRIIWEYQRNGTRKMTFYHETDADTFNFNFESGNKLQINGNRIVTVNELGTASASAATDFVAVAGDTMSGGLNIEVSTSNTQLKLKRTTSATGEFNIYTNTDSLFFHNVGQSTYPMMINSSGNVGIGTTSPQAALHVAGAFNSNAPTGNGVLMGFYSSSHGYIQLNGPSGGYIDFSTSGTDHKGRLLYDNTSNYMRFDTNGSEKMRIASSGNVGIGTTSPSVKFQVDAGSNIASFRSVGSGQNNKEFLIQTGGDRVVLDSKNADDGTAAALAFELGSSEKMRIIASGNVGIGTTSPSQKLHVAGKGLFTDFVRFNGVTAPDFPVDIDAVDGGKSLRSTRGTSVFRIDQGNDGPGYIGMQSADDFSIQTNNTSKIYITSAGNVGIGTTSPTGVLDVLSRDDQRFVRFRAPNGEERYEFHVGGTGNSAYMTMYQADGTTGAVRINSNGTSYFNGGNVGIGTTAPTIKFQAVQTTADWVGGFKNYATGAFGLRVDLSGSSGANAAFQVYTATGGGMLVKNNGKVGIGTTSPSSKLDVNGDISITVPNTNTSLLLKRDVSGTVYTYGSFNNAGSDFNINGTGNVFINADSNSDSTSPDRNVTIGNRGVEYMRVTGSGNVGIGTDNPGQKLEVNGNIKIGDAQKSFYGTGNDLEIYHDGIHSYIKDVGTGDLKISSNTVRIESNGAENMIIATANGSVSSYYNNVKKFETTNTGATVSGALAVSGKITNLTAGTGNLDAVNVQQLNDATTGALIFQGTWSAASTTTGVHATGSTSTIIVLEDPNLGVSIGSTVTGTGIPAGTTVTTYYNSGAFGLSAAITMVNGAVATFTTVGGIPDLSRADQKVTGNYYICETAGVATPNGASTTPDEWAVGDWVAFSDLATDAWQKIDNSSVLSGAGTGGKVPVWSGTGTSVTLADAPITVSGNNATFAGNVTTGQSLLVNGVGNNSSLTLGANTGNWVFTNVQASRNLEISDSDGTGTVLTLDTSGNATFAGSVFLPDNKYATFGGANNAWELQIGVVGDNAFIEKTATTNGDLFIKNNGSGKGIIFQNGNATALTIDSSQNATFAGNVTLSSTAPILYLANTTSSTGKTWRFSSAANGNAYITQDGVIDAITLSHTSGNATFAGTISSGTITSTGIVKASSTFQATGGDMTFYVNNVGEAMRVQQNTGEVGIGTTDPKSKLHVNGGIQMAGDTAAASADKVGTMRYRTGTEYVEVTGTEIITNGDFATDSDWSKGANTTISGGSLNSTSAGVYIIASQSAGLVATKYYKWKATYTVTSGGVRLGDSSTVFTDSTQTSSGAYTGVYQAGTSVDGNIYITSPSNDFVGSIDNISVIEVTAEDASYADMCMQTGSSTYEWVNIVRNTY